MCKNRVNAGPGSTDLCVDMHPSGWTLIIFFYRYLCFFSFVKQEPETHNKLTRVHTQTMDPKLWTELGGTGSDLLKLWWRPRDREWPATSWMDSGSARITIAVCRRLVEGWSEGQRLFFLPMFSFSLLLENSICLIPTPDEVWYSVSWEIHMLVFYVPHSNHGGEGVCGGEQWTFHMRTPISPLRLHPWLDGQTLDQDAGCSEPRGFFCQFQGGVGVSLNLFLSWDWWKF